MLTLLTERGGDDFVGCRRDGVVSAPRHGALPGGVMCSGFGLSVALVVVLPTSGIPYDCARPMPGSDHCSGMGNGGQDRDCGHGVGQRGRIVEPVLTRMPRSRCQRAGDMPIRGHLQRRACEGRGGSLHVPGRAIPSLRRRNCRVERFMPRRTAAPFGPLSTHFVSWSTARMCLRSAASRVSCGVG